MPVSGPCGHLFQILDSAWAGETKGEWESRGHIELVATVQSLKAEGLYSSETQFHFDLI